MLLRRCVPVVIALAAIGACSGDDDDEPLTGEEDSGTPGEEAGSETPDTSTADGGSTNDSGTTSDAALDADADALPTYKHYDINHVLSTGQSDSVANGASPFLTAAQPFGNLSFDVGVMTGRNSPTEGCDGDGCKQYHTPTSFIPLVEGDKFFSFYQTGVETMSSGMANQATVLATAYFAKVGLPAVQHNILVSLHGRSGNTYWCLRKNPCNYMTGYLSPFAEGLMQVTNAKAFAAAQNKSYVVRAVTTIHGGSDHYDRENELSFVDRNDGQGKIGNYGEALIEWQKDYEADVKAITGQTESVPLFLSQFGSWTDIAVSRIPVRQMEAHVKALGKVIVVTPNYPFVHYSDCLHYDNYSQRRLGAYFAKAYHRTVVEGVPWEPLRPIAVTRTNNVITVKFLVPVPPLVLDTTRVTNPGNYGFTYADSTSSATVQSVALAGSDTVTVTLSATPTGAAKKLRYALNAPVPQACPGPTQGARGNLRDSDTTPGYHKDRNGNANELHNWAVHFEADVP